MPDQPHPTSCLQRIINLLALAYLLFIALYLVVRFTIQDGIWIVSLMNTFAPLIFVPLPFLMILALIVRSRRAAFYLVPIIICVLVWFGPRFLPKNNALPANASTLRVMTNNVSHFNVAPEKVPELALSQQPDVIFLQEVQLSDAGQALATLDAAYPYRTSQNDSSRSNLYAAVNITYSRLPFVMSQQIDPHIPEIPLIYRDVIEVDGQRIALYNIHLLSPGGSRFKRVITNYFVRYVFNFDDTIRNSQIDALLAYLASEPYPYIAAGDFNTSDFSMTYTHLAAQMHDSFSEAAIGLGGSWPAIRLVHVPSFVPPVIRIDYIWHSAGLQTAKAWEGGFVGSDHLPMFADLVVAPS